LVLWVGVVFVGCFWCNEEFSDLVRAANREMDTAKRAELLDAATEILVEELPQIYLYNSVGFIGVSDDLDWSPRPDGSLLMFDARPAN
jgi:ABC-type transport system substrate-binding protein